MKHKTKVISLSAVAVISFVVFVSASFYSTFTRAEDNHVYTGAWSQHDNKEFDYEYTERNDLVAIQYKRYFGGTFVNSYGHRTYAAGIYIPTSLKNTPVELSVIAGVSYGYHECSGVPEPGSSAGWCPVFMPEFTLNFGRLKPSLLIASAGTRIFTVKWEF